MRKSHVDNSQSYESRRNAMVAGRVARAHRWVFAIAFIASLLVSVSTAIGQTDDRGAECTRRAQQFVEDLDRIFTENPRSVDPLLKLLQGSFPWKGCTTGEVLAICRGSKFFTGVGEQPNAYVISFNSAGSFNGQGFFVTFGLLKATGDSWLPFAKVNQ